MAQIIPIKELKNTLHVSELCHENHEPIYITKNGYGDMVMMSMEFYEQMRKRLEFYEQLVLSSKDFDRGDYKDAFEGLKDLREKYDLQSDNI
jgi:PHD/YefM family antitoxin component YafN of YafNO toxin-antitoxin module